MSTAYLKKPLYKTVRTDRMGKRITILRVVVIVIAGFIIARLFIVQVMDNAYYREMAFGGRSSHSKLEPTRGEVFLQNINDQKKLSPFMVNEDTYLLFADGRAMKGDHARVGDDIVKALSLEGAEKDTLVQKMTTLGKDPYVPLIKTLDEHKADAIRALENPGLGLVRSTMRFYPEGQSGAHISGYLGVGDNDSRVGKYGFEGFNNSVLQGKVGAAKGERDAFGAWIPVSGRSFTPAQDGPDIVLTIDQNIQHTACAALHEGMTTYAAKSGTVIVMDPKTGAILALCNEPTYDPNTYRTTSDISVFNNSAIFTPYEPGSVFKAFTMAAGLDTDQVLPTTTFEDKGYEMIDNFKIKNAAEKVYGLSSMRKVLIESMNTGAIFVARKVGKARFNEYVKNFGFGVKSGIELDTESAGTIQNIMRSGEVYMATASFGQGITATPLQLIAGYSAIANHGLLMQPTIIREKRFDDGHVEVEKPHAVRQVISGRTAATLSTMLTAVVDEGHAHPAGVKGYRIAGKTGTAQIADPGGGYLEVYNHTFIGYGPADDARFVMLVKYEQPNQKYADATTVHTFNTIASFLVNYMRIPPR